jgi:hypothetical protein
MAGEMKMMEQRILASQNEILLSIKKVTDRFDALENKVSDIALHQVEMDSKLKSLNKHVDESTTLIAIDVDKKLRDLKEDVQEERRKLIRLCNVVLFGVPENQEGLETASNMIKILLPDWAGEIYDDRIGSGDSAKPRPLRVKLDNYTQKRKALSSKRKLKTFPEFNGISVQPDMTKTEQLKSKEKSRANSKSSKSSSHPIDNKPSSSGVATRSVKRKSSSELRGSQTNKFGKGDNSIDID